jgi:hypothetical protein
MKLVGAVLGMVTCRMVIRCLPLLEYHETCKITNDSSGVPTTPTPMPKSVQINFLESIRNLKSSENLSLFIPGVTVLFIGLWLHYRPTGTLETQLD